MQLRTRSGVPTDPCPAGWSQPTGCALWPLGVVLGGAGSPAGGIGGAAFVWIVDGPLPVTAVVLAFSLAIAVCTGAGRHSIQPPMLRAMTGLAALVFLAVPTVTAIVQGAVP